MKTEKQKAVFAVVGPTASGKSELGIELALGIGGEIINCDSVQIYREIEIATAKVSTDEMRGVPHHLLDYVSPQINYTAADWAADAIAKIYEIEARGNAAILVGGTGFYLRALREPFFAAPKTDEKLRERLKELRERKGAEHLHQILRRVDPAKAEKLFPRDYVRTQRALEFFFQNGAAISAEQPKRGKPPEFVERLKIFALNPPREQLYERINRRAAKHFQNGLIAEVKNLLAVGLRAESNALGAHGYRRAVEYLRGERTLESALEQTRLDVRHYAKRQLTWFRREPGVTWLDGFGDEAQTQGKLFEILSEE